MATFTSVDAAIAAVTKVEKAEEGYLEKASNKSLDSKTANAGYNNYTKYWRDLEKLGLMGQGSSFAGGPAWYWCAGFQSWCFIEVFGLELAKKLLLHMPYISCATLGDKAKKEKQLYSTPKAGDIVLFWNGSRFSHTGFVYKVDKTTFYTVEGNTNSSKSVVANGGGVCLKSYSISTYQKKGARFFRPDYSLAVKKTASSTKSTTTAKTTASTSTSKTIATVKKVKVNTKTDPLNCRKTASASGTLLGKFAKGTTLALEAKTSNSWWKVTGKTTSGKTITGYCSASYLKEV